MAPSPVPQPASFLVAALPLTLAVLAGWLGWRAWGWPGAAIGAALAVALPAGLFYANAALGERRRRRRRQAAEARTPGRRGPPDG